MSHQWEMTLQDLPEGGYAWDTALPSSEMGDHEVGDVEAIDGLVSDVAWRGRLVHEGHIYRLSGCWQATIRRSCCRCLEQFDWHVEGQMERDFQLVAAGETEDADDVVPPPGHINLVDILREEIWLSWQGDVVCRDDCAGLCSSCGGNLNTSACSCRKTNDDHPFAILRQLKLDDAE